MGSQLTRIAAVQPAAPTGAEGQATMMAAGWRLAAQAAERGAELCVLPEYFNVLGLRGEAFARAAHEAEAVLDAGREHCRRTGTWLLLPLVAERGGRRYNSAHLLTPAGETALIYDKTHLTITERRDSGLTAGAALPVADTPFGRVGVMICYDVYFPEVARLLFLQGVDLILFPSLQRSDTPERCLLLSRARAVDTTCHLVRASYGLPAGEDYAPGKVYGGSCVIAPDGTVLAEAGLYAGLALADVDLRTPWSRPRCSGADPEPVRAFLREDRRPELYDPLTTAGPGPSK